MRIGRPPAAGSTTTLTGRARVNPVGQAAVGGAGEVGGDDDAVAHGEGFAAHGNAAPQRVMWSGRVPPRQAARKRRLCKGFRVCRGWIRYAGSGPASRALLSRAWRS